MGIKVPAKKSFRLTECLDRIVDNRGKTPPLSETGIELLEVNAIVEGHKAPAFENVRKFVLEETYANWFRSGHPRQGDTLISTVGAIGRVAYVQVERGCIAQNIVSLRPKTDVLDGEFLYYFLSSSEVQHRLLSLNIGVAQPSLKVPHLLSLEIELPPIPVQQRIAGILSAYDKLIENSQRRINILELISRALYREWFVYFRFPGHESIPLVPSALGEIPQGWEVKTITELCDRIESGGTPRRGNSEYWENGDIDWYKTGELWDGFLFGSQEQITHRGQIESSARLFEEGTILMAIYGSPTVGRMGLLTRRASCNQAALGLVANDSLISQSYLYFVLYSLRDHFNSLAQGAAQQNISKEKVASALAVLPPRKMIKSFDAVADPVFAQLKTLQSQIQNLRATRDALLPRLLSGQINVEAIAS